MNSELRKSVMDFEKQTRLNSYREVVEMINDSWCPCCLCRYNTEDAQACVRCATAKAIILGVERISHG